MTAMEIAQTDWSLSGGTITKQVKYAGLLGGDQKHDLLIEITTTRSHQTGLLEPHFRLVLVPDPLAHVEGVSLQGQLEIPSTPYDPPPVPVVIDHAEDELIVSVPSIQDSESFVETISSGEKMLFVLIKGSEHLLELPIPNNVAVVKVLRAALD